MRRNEPPLFRFVRLENNRNWNRVSGEVKLQACHRMCMNRPSLKILLGSVQEDFLFAIDKTPAKCLIKRGNCCVCFENGYFGFLKRFVSAAQKKSIESKTRCIALLPFLIYETRFLSNFFRTAQKNCKIGFLLLFVSNLQIKRDLRRRYRWTLRRVIGEHSEVVGCDMRHFI